MASDIRALAEEVIEDAAAPPHPMAGPHDREIRLAEYALAVEEAFRRYAADIEKQKQGVGAQLRAYLDERVGAMSDLRGLIATALEERRRG